MVGVCYIIHVKRMKDVCYILQVIIMMVGVCYITQVKKNVRCLLYNTG